MLAAGLAQVVPRRRPRHWLWRHYQYMCRSFVGLLAATNNEAFVRVPALARLVRSTPSVASPFRSFGMSDRSGQY